jgi:hypothetical protein
MAYNQILAQKVEKIVSRKIGFDQQAMFGGVGYLLYGNACCAVYKDYLILHLGEKEAEEAIRKTFVRPFDITGKPMKGWVMVANAATKSEGSIKQWVERAVDFVKELPRK